MDKIKQLESQIARLKERIHTADEADKELLLQELDAAERLLTKLKDKEKHVDTHTHRESTQATNVTPVNKQGKNIIKTPVGANPKSHAKLLQKLAKDFKLAEWERSISKETKMKHPAASILEFRELTLLDVSNTVTKHFKDVYGVYIDTTLTKHGNNLTDPSVLRATIPQALQNAEETEMGDIADKLHKALNKEYDMSFIIWPVAQGFEISLYHESLDLDNDKLMLATITNTTNSLTSRYVQLETSRKNSRFNRLLKLLKEFGPIKEEDLPKVEAEIRAFLKNKPNRYYRVVTDPAAFYNFADGIFKLLGYKEVEEVSKKEIQTSTSKANTLLDHKYIWVFTVLDQQGDTIQDTILQLDDAIDAFIEHEPESALLVAYPYVDPNPEDKNVDLVFADNPGPIVIYDNEKSTLNKKTLPDDLRDAENQRIKDGKEDLGKQQLEEHYNISDNKYSNVVLKHICPKLDDEREDLAQDMMNIITNIKEPRLHPHIEIPDLYVLNKVRMLFARMTADRIRQIYLSDPYNSDAVWNLVVDIEAEYFRDYSDQLYEANLHTEAQIKQDILAMLDELLKTFIPVEESGTKLDSKIFTAIYNKTMARLDPTRTKEVLNAIADLIKAADDIETVQYLVKFGKFVVPFINRREKEATPGKKIDLYALANKNKLTEED